MTNKEYFIYRWNYELPITENAFQSVPANGWEYKPHPKTRCAREIVEHLVGHPQDLIEAIDTGVINHRNMTPYKSLDDIITSYKNDTALLIKKLETVNVEKWDKSDIPFFVFGMHLYNLPLRDHCYQLLFDTVHHRGQLSTYYRPNGVDNPVIYGATAETVEKMMANMKK